MATITSHLQHAFPFSILSDVLQVEIEHLWASFYTFCAMVRLKQHCAILNINYFTVSET